VSLGDPRLRMFAGPNGSGKSTLKTYLPPPLLGVYLNPDEIERSILKSGFLDLADYGVISSSQAVLSFFEKSSLLGDSGSERAFSRFEFNNGHLTFAGAQENSYLASVLVDFLRQKLMEKKVSVTLETVMSHPGKVELLQAAQHAGYRTYLYYVATDDPAINISRVKNRVSLGGHFVREDKITSRYNRSLELLMPAIRYSNRAYIFDNSRESDTNTQTWVAEITDGKILNLKSDKIPGWFKRSVLDKIAERSYFS
jgi:predicted ABC-type ATPase